MTRRALALAAAVLAVVLGTLVVAAPTAGASRTVGDGPLDEILDAADAHKACGLTRDKLAALILAPTFRETGAPTTQAPSPMTLSRWDNQSALYSFGNPSTYTRAFWHPGVGPWQWDDASLQGLTAAQRIDSRFIADFTAEYMAGRWCANPSFSTVWAPWFGCSSGSCKTVYDEIYQSGKLTNVARDLAVSALGGMEAHTCTDGTATTFTCWFVDPAEAEGYAGFAIPSAGPAPITAPFYVYASGTKEVRQWLGVHTGYSIDIRASLTLTKDSRSGLSWSSGSSLCDLTTGEGLCDPSAPKGFTLATRTVNGNYTPAVGDFNGDGESDIFWYGTGTNPDSLWYGSPSGSFVPASAKVSGTYQPVVGDYDGDGRDDIFWYGTGTNPDSLWYGRNSGFAYASAKVSGTYTPVAGDVDGDGRDDIVWYGPGTNPDSLWYGRASGWAYGSLKVSGFYEPFVGNVDGVRGDDIFWYGPGADYDSLWKSDGDGTFTTVSVKVSGEYVPVVGDWNGDGRDDIVWYGEGADPDSLWYGQSSGWGYGSAAVDGFYRPVAGNFDGKGGDDVFWYRPGTAYDAIWFATA